jgi:hypothetical protein
MSSYKDRAIQSEPAHLTEDEIAANIAKVRKMKESVGGRCLTDAELDAYFEPVDSARTRNRLATPRPTKGLHA